VTSFFPKPKEEDIELLASEADIREQILHKSEMLEQSEQGRLAAAREMLQNQRATTAELKSQLEANRQQLLAAKEQRDAGIRAFGQLDPGVRDKLHRIEEQGGPRNEQEANFVLQYARALGSATIVNEADALLKTLGVERGGQNFRGINDPVEAHQEQNRTLREKIRDSAAQELQQESTIANLQVHVEAVVDEHMRRVIEMMKRVLNIADTRAQQELNDRDRENSEVPHQ